MSLSSISALPVTLLSFMLLSPLSGVDAMSDRSICVRNNAPILAAAAECGQPNSLRRCLQAVPDFVVLDDLRTCFLDLDCTIAEATTEALVIIKNCDASSSVPELRRRGPEAMPTATSNLNARDTSPAQTSTGLDRPTECSTAREIKTTACPVTSLGKDNFSQLPCTSTTITTSACAATNVCFDSGRCIYRDDTIHTSGLIATILLATAFVGGSVGLLVMYFRERMALSKARAREEALAASRKAQQQYDVADPLLQKYPDTQTHAAAAASGSGSNPFRDGHTG